MSSTNFPKLQTSCLRQITCTSTTTSNKHFDLPIDTPYHAGLGITASFLDKNFGKDIKGGRAHTCLK